MQTQSLGVSRNSTSPKAAPRWLRRLLRPLTQAGEGLLTLQLPSGEILEFGNDNGLLHATVEIRRWRALRRALTGGSLGWSESYLDGDWESADITALVKWALANEDSMSGLLDSGWLKRIAGRLRHRRNANSKHGSRKNIAFHYDLGNEFYQLWLDPSMTYSSALYSDSNQSLEQAQGAKYQYILDQLDIAKDSRVLEIGCGWGGFAEHLCSNTQASVEGVTLSREQLQFAEKRITGAGLQERASFSLTDYRDTRGEYDNIVSIEMLEAVGQEYWPSYFQTVYKRLKPGGSAAIQVITIDEERFESYCDDPDFIQTYIFPGGMLPSIERLKAEVAKVGLNWKHEISFGHSYARTLAEWNRSFSAQWDKIQPLGFDERFKRMWRYYLEYCEGGFLAGSIDVYQIFLEKPAS
ncbi:MAG TPA: SAM-dependent methyltransferase [Spongiibacteraceae bacterium]|nr:SAM-dependent methyltransferase [Spongiibacteraceae bacterium]HCS28172.1 SAM-dependent methyltransferase [Spongiibacteraceae bacterium]|tara:strand:- start:146 stop:1375 length:1230 start_codon:yes stop_codon:yes gene_type:complete